MMGLGKEFGHEPWLTNRSVVIRVQAVHFGA
jgi:hypothetical protein